MKRGNFPCFLRYSRQSFRSADTALSDVVLRKRKCVTPTKSRRSICLVSLECIDDVLLPIYTTEPFDLYPISYTPELFGASLTDSKVYHSAFIGVTHLPTFRSFYTKLAIDSNCPSMLTLAKTLGGTAWTTKLSTKYNRTQTTMGKVGR